MHAVASKGRSRRVLAVCTGLAALLLLITGCGAERISGRAVSVYADPDTVLGLPYSDGASGKLSNAQAASRTMLGQETDSTGSGLQVVSDIEDFWAREFPELGVSGEFRPVTEVYAWDANSENNEVLLACGIETYGFVNAMYCPSEDSIGWETSTLIQSLEGVNPEVALMVVLAHEYGHLIQHQARLLSDSDPLLVHEQQADCFAGSFISWVANGDSSRFRISTGAGLTDALKSVIIVRDADPNAAAANEYEHGSAFERVRAFQSGFASGVRACAKITTDSVMNHRLLDSQRSFEDAYADQLQVNQGMLYMLLPSLEGEFPAADVTLQLGSGTNCAQSPSDAPAVYCGPTRIIWVDPDKLSALYYGDVTHDANGYPMLGDYSAISVIASRFALAQMEGVGQTIQGGNAALVASCLTGSYTGAVGRNQYGQLYLDVGDTDEAVMALIDDGYVASDSTNHTVASTFPRVNAFASGIMGGAEACERYRG